MQKETAATVRKKNRNYTGNKKEYNIEIQGVLAKLRQADVLHRQRCNFVNSEAILKKLLCVGFNDKLLRVFSTYSLTLAKSVYVR